MKQNPTELQLESHDDRDSEGEKLLAFVEKRYFF